MMKRIIQLSILLVGLLTASGAWATTYYVDWVNGNDSNDGITKSTPWKRAPGMYGCASNCLAKQTAGGKAGDQFILKGGVTWPHDAITWEYNMGNGTAANPIYFGVDQTWYAGSSWSRPIIDAQGQKPNPGPYVTALFRAYGDGFIIDNIEFAGLPQLDDVNSAPAMVIVGTSSPSVQGIEVKNCYFHGWSHGGTATKDLMIVLNSPNMSVTDINLRIHDNVWDGTDTTQDMAMAYKGSAGHFYNNYITKMTNGYVGNSGLYFWGNTFKDIATKLSFDPTCHMNSIENMTAQSIIYNNLFDNVHGGVTIWTQPKGNVSDYVFNNVVVGDFNQGIQISNENLVAGNSAGIYVFNNTLQADDSAGGRVAGPSYANFAYMSFMTVRNNHLIGGGTPRIEPKRTTTQTISNNIEMLTEQAINAGYNATGTCPLNPPAAGATVGAGMDLHTLAAGIPSTTISDAATAALSDTTCGVKYDATKHMIIGPNRTPVVRGTNWDVGAYQFTGTQLTSPQNLRTVP